MATRLSNTRKPRVLTIHAIGAGELDKISIGGIEIGDLITIQNLMDLSGGSYIVNDIEEFHSDNPDELTDTFDLYGHCRPKRCSGIATEEKAAFGSFLNICSAFEDSDYLKRTVERLRQKLSA